MYIFNYALFFAGTIIVIFMLKNLRFPQILLTILSGTAALFACDLIFSFYGTFMPINIYTLLISSAGGIPGVILLTLLYTFF